MSSPRKFRVWDGEEMLYLDDYDGGKLMLGWDVHGWHISEEGKDGCLSCIAEQSIDDHTLMAYTGLDDAWGLDVWEADIVEFHIAEALERGFDRAVVGWDSETGQWAVFGPSHEFVGSLAQCLKQNEIEIIGNRYENPDLLKEPAA